MENIVQQPTKAEVVDYIEAMAKGLGMEPYAKLLIAQCRKESDFRADAHNVGSDCYGLFQLAKATAEELGVDRQNWKQNVYGGVRYMKRMLEEFHDYDQALAAFNWGPGHMARLLVALGASKDWKALLPAETKDYVAKINLWASEEA